MKKTWLKKLLLLGEIIFGLILALVIIVSVFPLVPPFKNFYHSRTVLTGSMEPKIPKGSVVINQWAEQKNLKVGDVITYQHPVDKKIIYITHRVVKIDKTGLLWRFETKGDANPASDFGLVTQAGTEGKVVLTIPLIGYLIEFFKTPVGFVLLVALPLLIFIVQQIRDVLQLWPKKVIPQEEDAPVVKKKKRKSRKVLVAMLFVLSFLAAKVSFVTYASFTSGQATMTGVTLSTAASFPGDVVINELMWMGSSGNPDDEWIELKNTTGNPIDLSNWQITKWVAGTHEELMLTIPSGRTISANGYFLISNFNQANSAISVEPDLVDSGVVLTNSNLRIKLYKSFWTDAVNLIDTADDGSGTPLAGVSGLSDWKSMERNDSPSTGWHTCDTAACHSTTYWDVDGHNWGTPKAANLSENDPSSPDYVAPIVIASVPTPESTPSSSIPLPEPSSESSASPSATIVEPTLTVSDSTPSAVPALEPTPEPLASPSAIIVEPTASASPSGEIIQ